MNVVSSQTVELREARFQDYQNIAALEQAHGLVSKPYDEWRRLWAGNPCYEELGPRWPIGWVLENDSGQIVGTLSNIPLPYMLRGEKLLVASGRGWAVDDKYRGYAPLLMDEFLHQERVDLYLTNTVNSEAQEMHAAFGSVQVPLGNWSQAAFVVTEHRGFAESALRIKGLPQPKLLSYPAGAALLVKDRFTAKAIPKSDITITKAQDFDSRFDVFWEILHHRSDVLLADRSSDMLKWHFSPSLDKGELLILTAARNGNIDAYAIFQRRDEPKFGLTRLRMVDFQACDWQDQYCAALMKFAYDECRRQRIQVLEQVGCELPKTRVFDRAAPYRRNLPGWTFYYTTQDTELAAVLAQPSAWDPSSYDSDASL